MAIGDDVICSHPNTVSGVMRNENDFEDREIFGRGPDNDPIDWPNAAGAFRGIEITDEGWRTERCPGLGTSNSRGRSCGALPRSLQGKRRRDPSLSAICPGVDCKRMGQERLDKS